MKHFDEIKIEQKEIEAPTFDKFRFQKQKLLFNVTRSTEICKLLETWLMSFEGGMSKQTFMSQVAKLDIDDDIAISQIDRSLGRRAISKAKTTLPPLPLADDAVNLLADGNLFIAVAGREKPLQNYIRNTYQTLKKLSNTYVLDLNDLKLEWLDKFQKGKSVGMLQNARDAEFLIIVGFETPIDLPYYIGDTLNTLRRYRIQNTMPIISTYAKFRHRDKFFEYFTKYSVK